MVTFLRKILKKVHCTNVLFLVFLGSFGVGMPLFLSGCFSNVTNSSTVTTTYQVTGNPTFSPYAETFLITQTKDGSPTNDLTISVSENAFVKLSNYNSLVWKTDARPLDNNTVVTVSGSLGRIKEDSFDVCLLKKNELYSISGAGTFSFFSPSLPISQTKNGEPTNDLTIVVSDNNYVKIIDNNSLVWKTEQRPTNDVTVKISGMIEEKEYDSFNVILRLNYGPNSVIINPVPTFIQAFLNQSGSFLFSAQDNVGKPLINPVWTMLYGSTKYFSLSNNGVLTWPKILPPSNEGYLLNIKCQADGLAPATTMLTVKTVSPPGSYNIPLCLLTIVDGVLIGHGDISAYSNLVVPSNVTSISTHAFADCPTLRSLDLSNFSGLIGDDAFYGCSFFNQDDVIFPTQNSNYASVYSDSGKALVDIVKQKVVSELAFGSIKWEDIATATSFTSLGNDFFKNCDFLTSFSSNSSFASIGSNAFYDCSSLSQVSLSAFSGTLGVSAFENCTALSNVKMSDSAIGALPENCFKGCFSLTDFSFPIGFNGAIAASVFQNCTKLSSVLLPSLTDKTIGVSAFEGCSSIKTLNLASFTGTISDRAFYGCSSITSLNLSTLVNGKLGKSAFENCTSISYLNLSGFKTKSGIESRCFYGCSSFTYDGLILPPKTSNNYTPMVTATAKALFDMSWNADTTYLIAGCLAVGAATKELSPIPQNIPPIFQAPDFSGCASLTSYYCGDIDIDLHGFKDCSSITSISCPLANTYNIVYQRYQELWRSECFQGCSSLRTCLFPSLEFSTISAGLFKGCSSLYDLNLQEFDRGVFVPGENAFEGCVSLNAASIKLPMWFNSKYDLTSDDGYLIVTTSNESPKRVVSGIAIGSFSWSQLSYVTGWSNIPNGAFKNCTHLNSINLSLTSNLSIGNEAFKNCTSLSSITTTNTSFSSIGNSAFENCTSLPSFDFEKLYGTMGNSAFKGCTSFTTIDFSTYNNIISDKAFMDCNITSVNAPNLTDDIGNSAFENCKFLTTVSFPELRTGSIGNNAFGNCVSLKTIVLADNYSASIGQSAFQNCYSLTNIDNILSCYSIGASAFKNCTSLSSVNLSLYNGNLYESTFQNCTSISSIDLTNYNGKTIARTAFAGCYSICRIKVNLTTTFSSWVSGAFSTISSYGEIYNTGSLSYDDTMAIFNILGINASLWDVVTPPLQ